MSIPVGPVIYAITVNGVDVKDYPLDTELIQEWGQHDLFLIRIEIPRNYIAANLKMWDVNAPVQIIFGRRPSDIQTWYGYVNHRNIKENADSGSKALQLMYVCIGTSKPMNTDKNRAWGQVTPTFIARSIAAQYGFRCVLTKTNWVLPYETQSNESDFNYLNRLAKKVGYRFWVSGSTMYFIDPAAIIQGANRTDVPVFNMDKLFTQLDTIREFSMNEGDNIPGSVIANRSIYGLDQNSGNVVKVFANNNTQTSNIESTLSQDYVPSINQAQNLVNAWQSLSQFWVSASAELYGKTFIYPGKTVYLSGKQMPQHSQGYWLVTSADHVLKKSGSTLSTADKYITRVGLIKNSVNVFPDIKNINSVLPEYVPCKIQQGQWISVNQTVIYDGVQSV